jgi:hypothetical protein
MTEFLTNPEQFARQLLGIGLPILAFLVIVYTVLFPEKMQQIAGWAWKVFARVVRSADKHAVANRLESRINSARKRIFRDAPPGLVEGKLKIRWTSQHEARALLQGGEVLVCMRRSDHESENLANGLMAYLPRAVVPRARRYVAPETMRAADLVLAKRVLSEGPRLRGALEVFFDFHLDPARAESAEMCSRIGALDEIDLCGWLVPVVLPELRRLGDALYPSAEHRICRADAEEMIIWLARLASLPPGDKTGSLSYKGPFFRIALIWVAIPHRLAEEGLKPYRRRAKRYLYTDRYDAIYLMGRDANIPAVEELASDLATDVRVEEVEVATLRLRSDFKARKLDREEVVVACLRRSRARNEKVIDLPEGRETDLPSDTHEFDAGSADDVHAA